MKNIALLLGDIHIYWHGVFMAAAILLAVLTSFILCLAVKRNIKEELLNCVLLSMPVGLLFSRLVYWSCSLEEYKSFSDHLNLARGGYALYGAIFGVMLAAALLKAVNRQFHAGGVLDFMAAGGALGIVIGRLSSYFSGDNIGIVFTSEKYHFFPLTVYNEHRGEWLFAVFNFEAFFELVIFVVLCVCFAKNNNWNKGMKGKDGDIALLFMLMHGCSQGLFDSMHSDALKFMNNSFIRLQQILGAVCFTVVTVIFVIRSFKENGFRRYQVVSLLVPLCAVGVTLCMELNRISYHNFIRNYSVIFLCMLATAINGILIYKTAVKKDADLDAGTAKPRIEAED